MLEAMATGCLVLGSDTAPVHEVLHQGVNGVLVQSLDVPAISSACVQALNMPVLNASELRRKAAVGISGRLGVDSGIQSFEALCKGRQPIEDIRHVA